MKLNLAQSAIASDAGNPALGSAILMPSLASFGLSSRVEFARSAKIKCSGPCLDTRQYVHTKQSHRFYATADVARSTFSIPKMGTAEISGAVYPVALSLGYTFRLEGMSPETEKWAPIVLQPYAGITFRAIATDLSASERNAMFGTEGRFFEGAEVGLYVALASVAIDSRFIMLTDGDTRIQGLTGGQLVVSLSFTLPWTILDGDKKNVKNDEPGGDESKNERQPEKGGTEATPAVEKPAEPKPAEATTTEDQPSP